MARKKTFQVLQFPFSTNNVVKEDVFISGYETLEGIQLINKTDATVINNQSTFDMAIGSDEIFKDFPLSAIMCEASVPPEDRFFSRFLGKMPIKGQRWKIKINQAVSSKDLAFVFFLTSES